MGASRGLSSPTGGSADRESSAPSVSEITITKTVDKASPLLAMSATSGKHYGSVMLQVRKAGGQPINYLLSDVTISKYGHSGGGDRPQESLSLNFTKITMRSDSASGASRRRFAACRSERAVFDRRGAPAPWAWSLERPVKSSRGARLTTRPGRSSSRWR